jgi:hypothetical protein
MTHNPDLSPGVGEDVAAEIDNQARRAALFQAAVSDFLFLAQHSDVELLRAVRDLNINQGLPDSYRHAHDVQMIRGTIRHLLTTMGFEQAIKTEPRGEISAPRRKSRPPIVDVHLP